MDELWPLAVLPNPPFPRPPQPVPTFDRRSNPVEHRAAVTHEGTGTPVIPRGCGGAGA